MLNDTIVINIEKPNLFIIVLQYVILNRNIKHIILVNESDLYFNTAQKREIIDVDRVVIMNLIFRNFFVFIIFKKV